MRNNGASGLTGLDQGEVVRVNLEKVIGSSPFATADRLRRFLRYIVEKSLAREGEALKEYAIGVEVYGRKQDFDPRIDAIVRVEASRLRGKLREYYETAGRDDSIRIELPKGTYAPLFSPRADPAPSRAESAVSYPEKPAQGKSRSAIFWVAILVFAALASFLAWCTYRD
jgi:hypothetical protein